MDDWKADFFMVTCHYPLLSVIYNLYTCLASKINYLPYFLMYFPRKLFFFEFGNPKVTVYKCAETIQGRKLFKGGNYMRKYGIYNLLFSGICNYVDFPWIQEGSKNSYPISSHDHDTSIFILGVWTHRKFFEINFLLH